MPGSEAFRDSGRGFMAGEAIHFAESDFARNQSGARKGGKQEEKGERRGE